LAKQQHKQADAEVIPFRLAPPSSRRDDSTQADTLKTWTAQKLKWQRYLTRAHRLTLLTRLVGIAYAEAMHEDSGITRASIRYIADVLGISERAVKAARQTLCDEQWLGSFRPHRRASYRTKLVLTEENMSRIDDVQIARKDARDFEQK
jgi:hypothetical protein